MPLRREPLWTLRVAWYLREGGKSRRPTSAGYSPRVAAGWFIGHQSCLSQRFDLQPETLTEGLHVPYADTVKLTLQLRTPGPGPLETPGVTQRCNNGPVHCFAQGPKAASETEAEAWGVKSHNPGVFATTGIQLGTVFLSGLFRG